jgi:hypothetical protein
MVSFSKEIELQKEPRRSAATNQSQIKCDALVMAEGKLKRKSTTRASRHVRAR